MGDLNNEAIKLAIYEEIAIDRTDRIAEAARFAGAYVINFPKYEEAADKRRFIALFSSRRIQRNGCFSDNINNINRIDRMVE